MNKESILYISILENISDACPEIDIDIRVETIHSTMGVARIFQRGGGHTDSYRGYSSDCHLNIVSCLLTRRLTKGGSQAPQDPPLATPMHSTSSQ